MKRKSQNYLNTIITKPISGQGSNFIPLENTRKPLFSGVFRRYKIGKLARNGLIY